MKKLIFGILSIIIFSTNILADTTKIFVDYSFDNKARYIIWEKLDVAILSLEYKNNPAKMISKFVTKCVKNKYWYKAKMIKSVDNTFTFKFYWKMDSVIWNVVLNKDNITCRKKIY